jgi:hypothetical protein
MPRLTPVVGGIRAADHEVARARPCGARPLTSPERCGATPSFPYRRTCGTPSHTALVWLCRAHRWVLESAPACCAECLARGGQVAATFTFCPEALT